MPVKICALQIRMMNKNWKFLDRLQWVVWKKVEKSVALGGWKDNLSFTLKADSPFVEKNYKLKWNEGILHNKNNCSNDANPSFSSSVEAFNEWFPFHLGIIFWVVFVFHVETIIKWSLIQGWRKLKSPSTANDWSRNFKNPWNLNSPK